MPEILNLNWTNMCSTVVFVNLYSITTQVAEKVDQIKRFKHLVIRIDVLLNIGILILNIL